MYKNKNFFQVIGSWIRRMFMGGSKEFAKEQEENNNNRGKYSNVSKETGIQGISVLYRVRIAGYKDRYFNSLERAKYYYQEIMEDKCTDKKR